MTGTPADRRPPEFGGERLLVIGTGAIAAMYLPFWLNWLITAYRDLEVQVVLTPSAERFVSGEALSVLVRREVVRDRWPEEARPDALHVRLTEWSDSVIVYPACVNFISRLALGLADTPALLSLQCTSAPIALAPSLPPGALDNPTLQGHLRTLSERRNVVVAPVRATRSLSTGRQDAAGAPPLSTMIGLLERLRGSLSADGESDTDDRSNRERESEADGKSNGDRERDGGGERGGDGAGATSTGEEHHACRT
ncbi:flavoprotein [Streptosporangium sp. NPDC049078]|uniref:flavoprotein n=1 Tax=Streptosporangium sp. NPDC049078 TaxID=3155767 RepID=UPI00342E100B